MAYKANDGSEHTNRMMATRRNSSLAAKAPAAAGPPSGSGDGDSDDSSKPSITDNPQAMQCIDQLKQMGYTSDDVAQAMDSMDSSSSSQGSAPQQSAPMAIPGMQ